MQPTLLVSTRVGGGNGLVVVGAGSGAVVVGGAGSWSWRYRFSVHRFALGLTEVVLGVLAFVFFAYLVLTGIGWFAFPFALLAGGALAVSRKRRSA